MADLINTLNYSGTSEGTLRYCFRKYYLSHYELLDDWLVTAPEKTKLANF